MKKIPTLFVRDPDRPKYVTRDVTPGCEWVLAGEGVATRKYDGACAMVRDGVLYKRREWKDGAKAPQGFEEVEYDSNTGKHFGWVPVDSSDPGDRWFIEAVSNRIDNGAFLPDGTYELVGPKVQGNPESYERHWLIPHAEAQRFFDVPRDFDGLRDWLLARPHEGVVFHHEDGRMAKVKRRDFEQP
jgi:hypothetical protein